MGAQFFVSDVNGYTEDFSGTLCATGGGYQTSSVQCLKALPDGQYLLRVTGLLYGNGSISWEFCGEVGEAYEQLYFSVSRGSCTPLDLSAVIFNTTGQIMEAETQVMLSGVVELVGVSAEMLSESDGLVLRHALANEVSRGRFAGALSPDEILIYSPTAAASDQDVSSPPRPNRALSLLWSREKTNKVGFEIPISISQLHGLDEASLELHLQKYFARVFNHGAFVSTVKSIASKVSGSHVATLRSASLLSLKIVHRVAENRAVSVASSVFVATCGAAGLLMGAMFSAFVYRKWRSSARGRGYVRTNEVEM